MADTLVNRVAQSGIITINLEDFYPAQEIVNFDLKDFLFMGMILKEKDFRTALKGLDWAKYTDKIVLIDCSTDAIIPMWAYMLVASYLDGVAHKSYYGTLTEYLNYHYDVLIQGLSLEGHRGKMVVIKGCGDKPVPPQAYIRLTAELKSIAKSIMYGEPCSTVPIYKQPRNN